MKTRLFMFPGQGSQQVGMGKEFFENSQEARKLFKLADDLPALACHSSVSTGRKRI